MSDYLRGWHAGHEDRDRGAASQGAAPGGFGRGYRDGWTAADVRHARGRR